MANPLISRIHVLLACLAVVFHAESAEIRYLGNIGFRAVMEELAGPFERDTGYRLLMSFGTVGQVLEQAQQDTAVDVITLTQPGIDALTKQGRLASGTAIPLAFSRTGVAVRKGAPRPDISSAGALKQTLLEARTVTYSDPATGAASGTHFAKVLDRLHIANEVRQKTVFHPKPGFAAHLVASGDAEIVVQPFQELVGVDGIDIIGPLPAELQQTLTIVVSIMAGAADKPASKALLDFLRSPKASAVIRAKGLEPAAAGQ
jgi:molybdate transport system substrate-binding protein